MAKGGRRAGAGHPTAAAAAAKKEPKQDEVARFQERALGDLDRLYDAALDLALGVFYEGCGHCKREVESCICRKPEPVRIYRQRPNAKALGDIISHIKGRPAQAQQAQAESSFTLICRAPRPPLKKRKGAEDVPEEEEATDAEE